MSTSPWSFVPSSPADRTGRCRVSGSTVDCEFFSEFILFYVEDCCFRDAFACRVGPRATESVKDNQLKVEVHADYHIADLALPRPRSVGLSLCVSVCVCVCLFVSLCGFVCLYVCASLLLSLSV